MFKKSDKNEVKSPPSKLVKILRGVGYVFIALIVLAIFGSDEGGDGYKYTEDGSTAQKYFIALQKKTKDQISSDFTDAQKKFAWIKASKELCSSTEFNAFGLQQDWLGKVSEVSSNDKLGITIVIKIDGYGSGIREFNSKQKWTERGMFTTLLKLKEGDMVRFSGKFKPGDMEGDNECLDEASLGDDPEFSGQKFVFDLAKIKKLDNKS